MWRIALDGHLMQRQRWYNIKSERTVQQNVRCAKRIKAGLCSRFSALEKRNLCCITYKTRGKHIMNNAWWQRHGEHFVKYAIVVGIVSRGDFRLPYYYSSPVLLQLDMYCASDMDTFRTPYIGMRRFLFFFAFSHVRIICFIVHVFLRCVCDMVQFVFRW